MDFNVWRQDLAEGEPTLREFLEKLDRYFEGEKFKAADFERAVETGLSEAARIAQIDIEGSQNG